MAICGYLKSQKLAKQKLCSRTMSLTYQLILQPMCTKYLLTNNSTKLLYQSCWKTAWCIAMDYLLYVLKRLRGLSYELEHQGKPMRPFVVSATIPYIAKTFAEQKLCSATMEPTHQLYMQTNVDKTLYSPTTQQSYSTKATLENFNKRGAKQVHCIANCVLN